MKTVLNRFNTSIALGMSMGILAAPLVWGETHGHGKSHGAHEHGKAVLSIALDSGTAGMVRLESPAVNIIGFEYKAKRKYDQIKQSDALKLLESGISKMVKFSDDAGCVYHTKEVELEQQKGEHSEVHAEFTIQCKKTLLPSEVVVDFSTDFSKIDDLEVQLLTPSGQSKTTLKKGKGRVEIK